MGFDTKYTRTDFEVRPSDNDYWSDDLTFNPYFNLSKKTRILASYEYYRKRYPHIDALEPSYKQNICGLGITSAVSPKTTVLLKGTYTIDDQKSGNDYDEGVYNFNLGYKISSRSDISFDYAYTLHNEYEGDVNDYNTNSISLSGNHRFGFSTKLRLSYGVNASFQRYPKYGPFVKENDTYGCNLGLAYAFRSWLDFSLTWTHTAYNFNVGGDYQRDVISFKTQAKF